MTNLLLTGGGPLCSLDGRGKKTPAGGAAGPGRTGGGKGGSPKYAAPGGGTWGAGYRAQRRQDRELELARAESEPASRALRKAGTEIHTG